MVDAYLHAPLLQVTAYSPTNRPLGCPVSDENGTFFASFQPDEAGEWRIHVTYDDDDIENSPFRCMVFDPRAIKVRTVMGWAKRWASGCVNAAGRAMQM